MKKLFFPLLLIGALLLSGCGESQSSSAGYQQISQQDAKQMMDEQEIVKAAKAKSTEMVSMAEERSAELRRVANEYADDALRRTEEAIAEALNEVRQSRSKFRSVAVNSQRQEPAED